MLINNKKDDFRVYAALQSEDIFSIPEKKVFDVLSKNSVGCRFVPIKRYKKVVWYKPSTWFRWLWQIKFYLID